MAYLQRFRVLQSLEYLDCSGSMLGYGSDENGPAETCQKERGKLLTRFKGVMARLMSCPFPKARYAESELRLVLLDQRCDGARFCRA